MTVHLLPPLRGILVLVLGCIALIVVICTSRHWKYVLRDSLLNSTLLIGFGLLVSPRLFATVLTFIPGVLALVIAISSWAYSDLLANLDKPPSYINLYPTRRRTVVLVGLSLVVIIHLVMSWREQAYVRTAKLLDVAAIEASARRSQSALKHLEMLKANAKAPLQGYELIEACGSVLRLAELDGVQISLPHPSDTICRSASTYRTTNLRQSN